MNCISEDLMPQREEKHCKKGKCTGRGVNSHMGWLPGQGELPSTIVENSHISFYSIIFPFSFPSSYILSLSSTGIFEGLYCVWSVVLDTVGKERLRPCLLVAYTCIGEFYLKSLSGPGRTDTVNVREEDKHVQIQVYL